MREYELVVVLNPMLTQEEAKASWERIKALVVERGGSANHEDWWGTRRLAYPIRRRGQTFAEGLYILGRFQMEPALAPEMEASLKLMEEVLRFLVVKAEAPSPEPPQAESSQPVESETRPAEAVE